MFAKAIDSATDTDKAIDDALVVSFQNFDPATPATAAPVIEGLSDAREAGLITTNDLGRDLFSEKRSARLDLHRLQIAAFTGFYVFVFLWSVNAVLALPEFSSNTLALLGASTASYLGYKFAAQ